MGFLDLARKANQALQDHASEMSEYATRYEDMNKEELLRLLPHRAGKEQFAIMAILKNVHGCSQREIDDYRYNR